VRPTFIIGICPEITPATQSFGIALATYALVMKAQGRTLMYPGRWVIFHSFLFFRVMFSDDLFTDNFLELRPLYDQKGMLRLLSAGGGRGY
jgi:hypothetical protein